MNILYVLPDVGIAGGVAMVFEHANRLIERGHNVKIGVLGGSTPSVRWYRLLAEVIPVSKIIEEAKNMDVVVATHYITAFFVNDLRTRAKKYYFIQHYESLFFTKEGLKVEDKFITDEERWNIIDSTVSKMRSYVDKTYNLGLIPIVTSNWLKTAIKHKIKPIQIKYGVNTDLYYPDPVFPKTNKFRILIETTQQNTKWKGLDDVIRVLEEDVELRSRLEVWTISADDPIYTGDKHWKAPEQDEIRRIFSSADLFLKMSWYEGWGLGAMQAMACGTPVLIADDYGCNTYAKDKYNCLMVKNRDIESAINKLRDIVNGLEPNIETIVNNGLKIKDEFPWDREINKLEKEYAKR